MNGFQELLRNRSDHLSKICEANLQAEQEFSKKLNELVNGGQLVDFLRDKYLTRKRDKSISQISLYDLLNEGTSQNTIEMLESKYIDLFSHPEGTRNHTVGSEYRIYTRSSNNSGSRSNALFYWTSSDKWFYDYSPYRGMDRDLHDIYNVEMCIFNDNAPNEPILLEQIEDEIFKPNRLQPIFNLKFHRYLLNPDLYPNPPTKIEEKFYMFGHQIERKHAEMFKQVNVGLKG